MTVHIGEKLKNRYRVDAFIGRGGMAEVYRVWDLQRGVPLAMKVLREDLAEDIVFLRRFEREAKNLTRLQHPNIVRCYGLEREEHIAYMLMDYIDGWTLRSEIFDAHGPLPMNRILEIMRPICSALNYAHQMGMVHCDVKSANIMISKKGMVYLTDFGIARGMDATTSTMVGIGTPAYMAPELIKGRDPTPQTDIYALGVVLYEMLTGGERPFTGERAAITGTTADKVRWEQLKLTPFSPAQFNSMITPKLEEIVLICLAKNISKRYASASDVADELSKEIDLEYSTSADHDQYVSYLSEVELNQTKNENQEIVSNEVKEPSDKKYLTYALVGISLLAGIIMLISSLGSHHSNGNPSSYSYSEPTSVRVQSSIPTATKQSVVIKPTATEKVQSCPGAPRQRLSVGEDAIVCTKSDPVRLRKGPSLNNKIIKQYYPGSVLSVIDGPICANNWSWWKVRAQDGNVGWMAEGGDSIDYYFLCPD